MRLIRYIHTYMYIYIYTCVCVCVCCVCVCVCVYTCSCILALLKGGVTVGLAFRNVILYYRGSVGLSKEV